MSHTDRAVEIIELILPSIKNHKAHRQPNQSPFVLGLTGLQGSGKSTLAKHLVTLLNTQYHLRAIDISLDDFYKTHADREVLRNSCPENKLLRMRGQPGTHDVSLAEDFFGQLSRTENASSVEIPFFDKSLFDGDGDRAPRAMSNAADITPQALDVIIFEGWCVGFKPLPRAEIKRKYEASQIHHSSSDSTKEISASISESTLALHRLQDLYDVNDNLSQYCQRFMGSQHFNALVHLDTQDLKNVYTWRLEQEHMLRRIKGKSMTDEEVVQFIQGYMPSYELYLSELRKGFFEANHDKVHVRVVLDKDRKVVELKAM